jgi:hypothetical protein
MFCVNSCKFVKSVDGLLRGYLLIEVSGNSRIKQKAPAWRPGLIYFFGDGIYLTSNNFCVWT